MARQISRKGYQALDARLESFRQKLAQQKLAMGEAAGVAGDWHDNAGFDLAQAEAGTLLALVASIEAQLKTLEVVDLVQNGTTQPQLGDLVTVVFTDDELPMQFTLVGALEGDPGHYLISIESPLGAAVCSAKLGDTVSFTAPAGEVSVQIIALNAHTADVQ